jgi:hypothetical protein
MEISTWTPSLWNVYVIFSDTKEFGIIKIKALTNTHAAQLLCDHPRANAIEIRKIRLATDGPRSS